jgi:hypothetical protein
LCYTKNKREAFLLQKPKELKILNLKPNQKDNEYFIFNSVNSTYIQVPKKILETIIKIHQLPNGYNHILVDVLATAINKRRLEDITIPLENWTNENVKDHYFPYCQANISFQKLIDSIVKQLCPSHLTDNETNQLIHFFAKCPHGYDVTSLIRAHAELNPVIT